MRLRGLASCATVVAAFCAMAVAVQSCGVMTSDDCAARANCSAVGGQDGTTSADVGGGDDTFIGPGDQGADAPPDMTVDVSASDVAEADAPVQDVGTEAGDVVAEVREAGEGGPRDAPSEEGTPPGDASDGCSLNAENCTNGIDDNCDGLIDCADPECQAGYTCAAPVPTGWSGPVEITQAASQGPALTACQTDAGYANPLALNQTLNQPPQAICGTCTCSASGQTCSESVNVDFDTNCNQSCSTVQTTSGACATLPSCTGLGTSFSVKLPAPAVSAGSCAPNVSPPTPVLPAVSWTTKAQVCSYVGPSDSPGGCSVVGSQCVHAPSGSYGTKVCVYSTAATPPTSCPAGYNAAAPSTFYEGTADTRGCTGCTCSGPTGGSCSGSLSFFSTSVGGCNGTPAAMYTMNSLCSGNLSTAPAPGFVQANYTLTPGTCSVQSQPQPTGTAVPATPITVCCM
ncbi:MAG TPA: hypothetical protein VE987_09250 [Polyangiaceae bacterium]|nr:hypothetical protein [Polyangiaceae bacterium]